jgi:pimeloyl-[acyl-carrier protein] synthase
MNELDRLMSLASFYQDPHPIWARLRAQDPIHWSDPWQAWIVTRYEDVAAVHSDPRFQNRGRAARYVSAIPEDRRKEFDPFLSYYAVKGFNENDPPEHTRVRALGLKALNPTAIDRVRSFARDLANRLIDDFNQREADLVAQFAQQFSPAVIGHILGLPLSEVQRFKRLTREMTEYFGRPAGALDALQRSQEATIELRGWLQELIDDHRRVPRADVMSALIEAEEDGERFTEDEVAAIAIELMVAGDETTANLIPTGMLLLLKNPDQLARLRADRSLLKGAVDEMLRFEPPLAVNHRLAGVDIGLRGARIRAGDTIRMSIAAANRDPDTFADPDTFDIARRPNKHLTFGLGTHFCPGHSLARMELEIAFNLLLDRLADVRLLKGDVRWYEHYAHRGLLQLPVAFNRQAVTAA